MRKIRTLIHGWLVLDFFGEARRHGGGSSTLTTTIFAQAFFALVFASLLYPETPRVPFVAANMALSTLLVSVGLLGDRERVTHRRADHVLLGPAPIGAFAIVLARAGHAAFYVVLLTIGMALPPAVLLGYLTHDWGQVGGYVALACLCSGIASGTLGAAVRLAERTLGAARAVLFAGSLKTMLLGCGLVLFATSMRRLQGTADMLPIGRFGAESFPPYHAARFLAEPTGESWRLMALIAAAVVLVLLTAVIGGEREPRRTRVVDFPVARGALRRLSRSGPVLGIAEFVAVSMWRSPGFRARVLPLLGLPAGMVFLATQDAEARHGYVLQCVLLQLPAIYLPFLIAFLPRADEDGSGWIFDHANVPLGIVRDATWRALVTHVLGPIHAVALLLLLAAAPNFDTLAAVLFAAAVGVIASRAMVRRVDSVPFSRSGGDEFAVDLGDLFGAALLLAGLGGVFGGALGVAGRWVAVATAVAGATALLVRTAPRGPEPTTWQAPERTTETDARPRDPRPSGPSKAALTGELRAIAVLYGAVCVLPVLIGTMFAK